MQVDTRIRPVRHLATLDGPAPTPEGLRAAIAAMRPGETIVYYVGFIAQDRFTSDGKRVNLPAVADLALQASSPVYTFLGAKYGSRSTGYLTQRRLTTGLYEYRFTKGANRK